jgi:hypothetical protein
MASLEKSARFAEEFGNPGGRANRRAPLEVLR